MIIFLTISNDNCPSKRQADGSLANPCLQLKLEFPVSFFIAHNEATISLNSFFSLNLSWQALYHSNNTQLCIHLTYNIWKGVVKTTDWKLKLILYHFPKINKLQNMREQIRNIILIGWFQNNEIFLGFSPFKWGPKIITRVGDGKLNIYIILDSLRLITDNIARA